MPVLHPDLDPVARRRLLHEGVSLFNDARFFECHESFEEVWRSTRPDPKDLLQGLIQIAAGMYHHLERGRPDVARRVLAKGRHRIEPYAPCALGIDLEDLVDRVRQWESWLMQAGSPAATGASPPLPRIRILDPESLR